MKNFEFKDDISIVLCGEAGQGIQTIENLLTKILKESGYNVFATKEYMSRVRGGTNSTEIRVSSKRVRSYVDRIDLIISLSKDALKHLEKRILPDTLVLGERENAVLEKDFGFLEVPFSNIAKEIGNKIFSNTVAISFMACLFNVPYKLTLEFIKNRFSNRSEEIISKNLEAVKRGYEEAKKVKDLKRISIKIVSNPVIEDELLLNGTQAVSLGVIAGGCNFVSSYPMSPSTGVLTFLAQNARSFEIIVEQAEDEISAINMALGAWYAGARGMVTTSGGGFALMAEALSLAGMIESPIVIHLAQRPGPATGLPTRTEQGDLELALYSGHGEFPRVIFAPGSIEEAFYLTQRAFNIADKYQISVFILTDEYLLDSYYNIPKLDLGNLKIEKYIVKTEKGYKRYEVTDDGISPRGIPGYGEGLVAVDSDEHDEEGHITENLDIRIKMVEKRLEKLDKFMNKDSMMPEFIGDKNYKNLIVCWGSTRNVVKEAMSSFEKVGMLHFKQVYPIHPDVIEYFNRADKIILVEGNATGQFGKLLKLNMGVDIDYRILKYNGMQFSVEEVRAKLEEIVGGK